MRLHRRQALVPQLHDAAGRVGHELREAPRVPGRRPLPALEVQRQADDESPHVFLFRQGSQRLRQRPRVAWVERAPGVREQAELVVDRDANPGSPRVERANATRAMLRSGHRRAN